MYLPGLPYYEKNCLVECRRRNMMKYCNCSVDIFYPGNFHTKSSAYVFFIIEMSDFFCRRQLSQLQRKQFYLPNRLQPLVLQTFFLLFSFISFSCFDFRHFDIWKTSKKITIFWRWRRRDQLLMFTGMPTYWI